MFKKEKIRDLHYSVSGFLSATDIQAAADKILTEYGQKAKMPGFRPGHIPLSVLRKKYNATAFSEAVDKMINQDLTGFTAEKKIRLAGAPKADVAKWEIGADMEYTMEFDILPTLPKIDLEKLTIIKKIAAVPESEVDKSLENLRKSRATFEKQGADYAAAIGDTVVIDFKGFMGDEAFEGGEAKKHRLVLGSGAFIPGFEEKIAGHKSGDKFDINVKFPKEYHSANLAGKDAKFEVEIHEIRKPILAELNAELAKSVGQESVDELKKHICKILNEQYDEASKREMRNELLEILADKVRLELPETLVVQELEMAKREAGEDSKFDEKKERKDAERRVKLGLILAEWGTANKVEVSREDLQNAIWTEAARYPDPQQVFDFYNKNQNALSMLRGMLFERKALDAMMEKVKVKEKSVKPDELFKQADVK